MDTRDKVSFVDLKKASPSEKRRLIAHIADRANEPANGRVEEVGSEIARYEESFGISSEKLLEDLYYGKRAETDDILPWLRLIRLREMLLGETLAPERS